MLKRPLSHEELTQRLIQHGMKVDNPQAATKLWNRISYYRMSGYALQFRSTSLPNDYRADTEFKQILCAYEYDRMLRAILRDCLEIVEVRFRAVISDTFAEKHCAKPPYDGHYQSKNFYDKGGHKKILDSISREEKRNADALIVKHHKKKYGGKLPIWAMAEFLSFSSLSKLYACMYRSDQEIIARKVGVQGKVLKNHLHSFANLRNKACHGGRLFNNKVRPRVSFSSSFLRANPNIESDSVFAAFLAAMRYLPMCSQHEEFINRLLMLNSSYQERIDLRLVGIYAGYEKLLEHELRKRRVER